MKRILIGLLLVATTANTDLLLVLNKADAWLSMVDLTSMKVVATIPVGDGPHEIAVSADGKVAVLKTLEITGSIATGNVPDGLACAVSK